MEPGTDHTERTDGHFVQVPLSVLCDPRQSDGAKVMYAILQSYDWAGDGGQRKGCVWPSLPQLAKRSRKSTRTVSRLLRSLEDAGFIRTKWGGEHRATRHLLVSAAHKAPVEQDEVQKQERREGRQPWRGHGLWQGLDNESPDHQHVTERKSDEPLEQGTSTEADDEDKRIEQDISEQDGERPSCTSDQKGQEIDRQDDESDDRSAGRKRRLSYDEIEQLIFEMRLQGMSDEEIDEALKYRIGWRTLRKVFPRIERFDGQARWRAFRQQHLGSASLEGEDPVREDFRDLLEQMSIGPHSKYPEIAGAMLVMLREEEPRATPGEIMNALKARGISDDRAAKVWRRLRTPSGRRHLLQSVTVAETLVWRLQLWCLECRPTREEVAWELALTYDIDEQEAEEVLDLLEEQGIDGPNGGWQEEEDLDLEEEHRDYYPVVGGGFISSHGS